MPVSEIYEVKVRKFSILKSAGLLGATYATVVVVIAAVLIMALAGA